MNHQVIDEYLEKLDGLKAQADTYNMHALRAQIACDEMNDDEGDPGVGPDPFRDRWTVGYSDGKGSTLSGLIVSRNGATDAKQAIPMLRKLAKAGYTILGREDFPDFGRLAWKMRRRRQEGDKTVDILLHLQLYLPTNNPDATCSWVQVGEKTEPVMELRCGGQKVDLSENEGAVL